MYLLSARSHRIRQKQKYKNSIAKQGLKAEWLVMNEHESVSFTITCHNCQHILSNLVIIFLKHIGAMVSWRDSLSSGSNLLSNLLHHSLLVLKGSCWEGSGMSGASKKKTTHMYNETANVLTLHTAACGHQNMLCLLYFCYETFFVHSSFPVPLKRFVMSSKTLLSEIPVK